AAEGNLPDSGNLRELLLKDVAGNVIELTTRERLRGQCEDENGRTGRVDLAIGWIGFQARWQVRTCGIDGGLHIAGRTIDVAIKVELQGDPGLANGALRGHFGDIGNLAEVTFERFGDAGRHRRWAGAGQLGRDRDRWIVNLWQRRDR